MLLVSATLLCAYAPPAVVIEHSLQGNTTQCLLTNCAPALKACAADAVCDAGIKCLEKCPVHPGCLDHCIETHLDGAMYAVGTCGAEAGCFNPKPSGMFAPTDCHALSDQKTCDADDACAWCEAGAVPDACKTLDEAKALPASVFQCDKIQSKS